MKYRLGEICDVVSGGTPSRATAEFWDGGTIPWIKIGNIQRKYVDEADEYITQAGLEVCLQKCFQLEPFYLLFLQRLAK